MPFGIGFFASGADSDYRLIATAFGTGSSNQIIFDSIPQGYKHLQLRYVTRSTNASNSALVYLLQNNSANPRTHRMIGNGSGKATDSPTAAVYTSTMAANNATSNSHGVAVVDILDYSSTSKYKTIRSFNGVLTGSGSEVGLWSGFWADSLAAISYLSVVSPDGNFTTSSRVSLYGIRG